MARQPKSQWEFGDLFAPGKPTVGTPASDGSHTPNALPLAAPARKVWSVFELTVHLKRLLEREFPSVWISGEISNFRSLPSGHLYFILKDAQAQINCVLFRSQAGAERSQLKDGAQVTLGGDLTVYEMRGVYQLRIAHVEMQGTGALQAAFERLKARLTVEGLFDGSRKRLIPRYPRRLGVVTSPATAALQDVLHVLSRRSGHLEVVLSPCRVQGVGAAVEIAAAIDRLNAPSMVGAAVDVILLTRGGGALEDLWCFNEEVVARAIVRSKIPVISAVGHEIDFTISDFAADLRAATPSAAAELLTEGYMAAAETVRRVEKRLSQLVRAQVQARAIELGSHRRRLMRGHPQRILEARSQWVDEMRDRLSTAAQRAVIERRHIVEGLQRRELAVRPEVSLKRCRGTLIELVRRQAMSVEMGLSMRRQTIRRLADTLRLLSPQQVLARGYSITLHSKTGRLIQSWREVEVGQEVLTLLSEGEVESTVKAKRLESKAG